MSVSLRRGMQALRFWRNQRDIQHTHGKAVDTEDFLGRLRAAIPGIEANLAELHRDGVSTLPGYWSADKCEQARGELDRLLRDYPGCIRRFSGDADQRMFGVETVSELCRSFHEDPLLRGVGECEGGLALYNLVTLGARIDGSAGNRGSGDGWHRDAFGYQFKAIIYLNDVDDDNGPFEYLVGSHRPWRAGLDSVLGRLPPPPESRIARETVEDLTARGLVRPRRFTGKAGTVILANTAGVHWGAPLRSGHRYALTNYYYFPFQVGKSLVEKFEPLPPGTAERFASLVADNEMR